MLTRPGRKTAVILFSAAAMVGCDYERIMTKAPSDGDDRASRPATIETFPVRERVAILPGSISWPPPAEPGLTAGQCRDLTDGGPVQSDGCITAVIGCNQTVVGHTRGGIKRYDTRFYESHFCTPALTHHDQGDERVYRLDVPGGDHIAVVTLDTPCGDLDMAAFRWKDSTCPRADHVFDHCEMWPETGTKREQVRLVSQGDGTSWYIVVEGKDDGDEGAFSLTTQCKEGVW